MTPSIVEALQTLDTTISDTTPQEPPLSNPAVGKPISHGQIIDLRNHLAPSDKDRFTLEKLLRGASVYVPPPPPKAEPVSLLLPRDQLRPPETDCCNRCDRPRNTRP